MAGHLEVERLRYQYPQREQILGPLSFQAGPGSCWWISGPSGCGKSTLARCLSGLIPHLYHGTMSGAVVVDGMSTTTAPLWQITQRVGLVAQNPAAQLLAGTVEDELIFGLENLGLDYQELTQQLEAGLERFGLQELRRRIPQTLSGGEQQRLILAANMARQPAILVLDEPFSMLDSAAAQDLSRELERLLRAGTTIIVCEHRKKWLQKLPQLHCLPLSEDYRSDHNLPLPPIRAEGAATLRAQGLTVQRGKKVILRDLSLTLHQGEVTALVGKNGVGKTTLLRTLVGLQPTVGKIEADAQRPDLGMVFQNADLQLFNSTVREEILYRLPRPDGLLYEWLLEALDLKRYEGMPPLLLSEGEKKRVALAAVLMRRPRDGILLDEPALGQDWVHKALLLKLLRAWASAGYMVLFTTHDLDLAAEADRLLILEPEGRLIDRPPKTVLPHET